MNVSSSSFFSKWQERIRALGRDCEFFNSNAADEDKRKDCVEQIRQQAESDVGMKQRAETSEP